MSAATPIVARLKSFAWTRGRYGSTICTPGSAASATQSAGGCTRNTGPNGDLSRPIIRAPSFLICASVAAAPSLNRPSVRQVPAGSGNCFTAQASREGPAARLVPKNAAEDDRGWTVTDIVEEIL